MSEILILILGALSLMLGSVLGYFARQSIAKRKADALEITLKKKHNEAKKQADLVISKAKQKASQTLKETEGKQDEIRRGMVKKERFLLEKEKKLEQDSQSLERDKDDFREKVEQLKQVKKDIEGSKQRVDKQLEKVSGFSKEKAKQELLDNIQREHEAEILERIRKVENEGEEKFEKKAKQILATTIQRHALSQVHETTTTTVNIPSDEIKGKIIGKEGRNIKVLERLTGTEVIIDDTPETVIISGFNPVRRHVAKLALSKLVKDGRIQPARIEKEVKKAEQEINDQIKKAGEQAVFQAKVLGLDPKIVQLLGRLHFRTSYGQNVLLHSLEVSHLAAALAAEMGANTEVCKRAGLLHDIGKSIDRQVEGSHIDIGMKLLEKFGESQEIINAMKSHHGDYEPESIEAVLIQAADQISGARPGARKESLDEYINRLEDLEKIPNSFSGVREAYAIQAGRELRVFVKPEEISDLQAHALAKNIASRIQEELRYPGEIKITVIREKRIVEHAR